MSQKTAVLCGTCQNHLGIAGGCAVLSVVDKTAACKLCGKTSPGGFSEFNVGITIECCLANRKQNIEFVEDLLGGIRRDLSEKIRNGQVPRTWNGKQLRKLIAEKAKENDYVPMTRQEKSLYHNDVFVNNL